MKKATEKFGSLSYRQKARSLEPKKITARPQKEGGFLKTEWAAEHTPEQLVFLAVIQQAWDDLIEPRFHIAAKTFLQSQDCLFYASVVGIHENIIHRLERELPFLLLDDTIRPMHLKGVKKLHLTAFRRVLCGVEWRDWKILSEEEVEESKEPICVRCLKVASRIEKQLRRQENE